MSTTRDPKNGINSTCSDTSKFKDKLQEKQKIDEEIKQANIFCKARM
jgi:hypothetical protein